MQAVTVVCRTVLTDVPCHAAVEIGVFDAFDDPVELSVRLALTETDDAFRRNGDGVEDPFIRNGIIDAHVRAACVATATEVEMDAWIRGIVDVARTADDEARSCTVPPVFVAEYRRIADMRWWETDPHRGCEVVAIFQLEIFCVFQHDAFADIVSAGDAQAFAKLAAFHARFDVLPDNGDFQAVRSDVGWRFRIKRQICKKAFLQRPTLDFGDFRADDMAVQIQRFEIDAEMGQCRDRHVVIAWNAGQRTLCDVLADHEDRDGVGVAAKHAVALAVAAMVAGDENQPVFVGEIRSCGNGVEQLADDDVRLHGGVDVLLAVRIEAV